MNKENKFENVIRTITIICAEMDGPEYDVSYQGIQDSLRDWKQMLSIAANDSNISEDEWRALLMSVYADSEMFFERACGMEADRDYFCMRLCKKVAELWLVGGLEETTQQKCAECNYFGRKTLVEDSGVDYMANVQQLAHCYGCDGCVNHLRNEIMSLKAKLGDDPYLRI